ncbi:MAG: TraR/DksA C4-type zinc finger protein [Parcubacteria group bacterium]|nr:TraR/DksA C4-type zinc finger protein [Parcubacteria group bacterium]
MIDINTYKKKLEEERGVLVKELSSVGVQQPRNPNDWEAREEPSSDQADPSIVADALEDVEERHGLTNTLEERLKEVNAALARIEEGEYGKCDVCGKEIEEDRLLANPAAATCTTHMA